MGFCVASTKNGSGSACVCPAAVTACSCMACSSAACVLGGARLISSASTAFAKMGPFTYLNTRRPVAWSSSSSSVPVMSLGMRSGVNGTREMIEQLEVPRVRLGRDSRRFRQLRSRVLVDRRKQSSSTHTKITSASRDGERGGGGEAEVKTVPETNRGGARIARPRTGDAALRQRELRLLFHGMIAALENADHRVVAGLRGTAPLLVVRDRFPGVEQLVAQRLREHAPLAPAPHLAAE